QSDGVRYAVRHLGRLPRVVLAREMTAWGLRPLLPIGSATPPMEGRSPRMVKIGFLVYDVLVILAVYGLVVLRRHRASTWNLVATFVVVAVTAGLFYGNVRFRQRPNSPWLS